MQEVERTALSNFMSVDWIHLLTRNMSETISEITSSSSVNVSKEAAVLAVLFLF